MYATKQHNSSSFTGSETTAVFSQNLIYLLFLAVYFFCVDCTNLPDTGCEQLGPFSLAAGPLAWLVVGGEYILLFCLLLGKAVKNIPYHSAIVHVQVACF